VSLIWSLQLSLTGRHLYLLKSVVLSLFRHSFIPFVSRLFHLVDFSDIDLIQSYYYYYRVQKSGIYTGNYRAYNCTINMRSFISHSCLFESFLKSRKSHRLKINIYNRGHEGYVFFQFLFLPKITILPESHSGKKSAKKTG